MKNPSANGEAYISLLSRLVIGGYSGDLCEPVDNLEHLTSELSNVTGFSEEQFSELVRLADMHHVTVRALAVLRKMAVQQNKNRLHAWCDSALRAEKALIWKAVEWLYAIVQALEMYGCPVCVIKSLDHWPDLGSDLDLYTSGTPDQVVRVMRDKVKAHIEPRSWGDRLANKWNFRIPRLDELIEIHVRYLGQTGEQKLMAARVLERAVTKTVNGRAFPVPAPEEQILTSTLQRMYRHFYFRLCDIGDIAVLVGNGAVDFAELRRGAELGGIWPGVASFLLIVARYVEEHGGFLPLPEDVISSACSPDLRVQFRANFLRVPMKPAAGLYGSQLLSAGRHGDFRAISRLPLLPPLAVSALVAYRLTGSDKGVW
jgi:putative nucleotidyltransferase-like protein